MERLMERRRGSEGVGWRRRANKAGIRRLRK